MMLDVDTATPFLLRRGLIDVDAVLAGDLTIRSLARRNRNLLVRGPGGSGYLLKQPDDPALGGAATLRAEAAFYDACRRGTVPPEVARLVPRLADFDPDRVILALDLIPDALTFWELDWTGAAPACPPRPAWRSGTPWARSIAACASRWPTPPRRTSRAPPPGPSACTGRAPKSSPTSAPPTSGPCASSRSIPAWPPGSTPCTDPGGSQP